VHAGDVLLTFADAPVSTVGDLKAALASVHGQDTVTAEIWRNRQEQSIRLQF
jgi:S1-C subfamily serine protease